MSSQPPVGEAYQDLARGLGRLVEATRAHKEFVHIREKLIEELANMALYLVELDARMDLDRVDLVGRLARLSDLVEAGSHYAAQAAQGPYGVDQAKQQYIPQQAPPGHHAPVYVPPRDYRLQDALHRANEEQAAYPPPQPPMPPYPARR